MRLADFITANTEAILVEWTAFARIAQPAAGDLSELALRDHAAQILTEIASDMGRPQDDEQQLKKSQGLGIPGSAGTQIEMPARAHAIQRARNGFETNQMVAEYRALRATVLRLWSASHDGCSVDDLNDVTRFNEAVDEALVESLKHFMEEVDRARDLFLGVLGHDLRGPLSIIASCAHMEARGRPEGLGRATIILRNVAHMKALLDDVVEYARNRLGAPVAIQPTAVELEKFARETIEEILAINPERVIELDAKGNLQGQWDVHRLHQVLSNLIFNALKYGEIETPVAVTLDGSQDNEVVIAVHNMGAAIPAEVLPNIFEPLVRANADHLAWQSSGANMGLGLYAAREIVKAHSGEISVASSNGDGTRFEVRLPRHCSAVASR